MEKIRPVQFVLMISLVLGLFVGQSAASCRSNCTEMCKKYDPGQNLQLCVDDCMKRCNTPNVAQYFCKLGCSSSFCDKLSTKENPAGEEKVETCVKSCSKTCTNI